MKKKMQFLLLLARDHISEKSRKSGRKEGKKEGKEGGREEGKKGGRYVSYFCVTVTKYLT
jgi:flagellar biosynthesis/type III secretory pathway protein FliH